MSKRLETNLLTDWLTDWLTGWLTNRVNFCCGSGHKFIDRNQVTRMLQFVASLDGETQENDGNANVRQNQFTMLGLDKRNGNIRVLA